jgi:hypothetical protein
MGRLTVVKVVSREISKKIIFRCQKLRASMRKMAQSDWSRCSPNWLSNLLWVRPLFLLSIPISTIKILPKTIYMYTILTVTSPSGTANMYPLQKAWHFISVKGKY